MHILLRIALALAGTLLCVPLGARLIVLDNNKYRNEQCTEGPYCFSYRSLTVRASGHWILSVFHSCNFLLRLFFCVNYKALGKRRMWLRLSIKCSFQLRNPTPEIETLLWRGVRGGVGEGSIACSPLLLRPLSSCPWPVNRCSCSCCSISFSISLLFCARQEKGQAGGKEGGRWRELTYKSSNGHSLWFGLAAPPPLWSPHMCQYLCEMRLQSHRHETLSIILGGRCVCVVGMVSWWVWFELGFSSNCSACCCWFSFGNLCSVCIVCRSVKDKLLVV